MPDGTWRIIDLDAVVRFLESIGAKDLSTAYAPPEATLVAKNTKRVLFRVPDSVDPEEVLVAHPTFDIWSLGVISFMALARRSLFESDNRDRLRGSAELLKLATWGAKHLSDALDEADREMVTDKVSDVRRLKSTRFLAFMLQADPANRPQSCVEALAHPFFPKDKDENENEGEEETKGEEEAVVTVPPPSDLHLEPLHLAAALDDVSTIESTLSEATGNATATNELLNVRETLLGRRPLHFAVDFVHPNVVRVLIDAGADVKAEDDAGATPLDRVPAARQRYKGDAEKEAALQKLSQMLTMAVLALSLPFAKSLPLHLGIEVGICLSPDTSPVAPQSNSTPQRTKPTSHILSSHHTPPPRLSPKSLARRTISRSRAPARPRRASASPS